MNMNTPILITGSTGFIGSNLTHSLVSKGYEVHLIIREQSNLWRLTDIVQKVKIHYSDLLEFDSVRLIVDKIKPKTIFHLATYGPTNYPQY